MERDAFKKFILKWKEMFTQSAGKQENGIKKWKKREKTKTKTMEDLSPSKQLKYKHRYLQSGF